MYLKARVPHIFVWVHRSTYVQVHILIHYPLDLYISKVRLVIIPVHTELSTVNITTSSKIYVLEDKLTKMNFRNRKSKIELMLHIEGLLKFVDVTWEEPIEKMLEECKTWKAQDKMARLEILLHIDDKQANIYRRLTMRATTWATLKELYKPHDGMTKLHSLGRYIIQYVYVVGRGRCFYLPSYLGGYVITVSNLIPEDIKTGLIANKLPKS